MAVQIAIFMGRMQNAMVKAQYKKQINLIGPQGKMQRENTISKATKFFQPVLRLTFSCQKQTSGVKTFGLSSRKEQILIS